MQCDDARDDFNEVDDVTNGLEQVAVNDNQSVTARDHHPVVTSDNRPVMETIIKHEEQPSETTRKTPSHLTEQGFFDLKFYHNKLW